jgi:hypothetical protein
MNTEMIPRIQLLTEIETVWRVTFTKGIQRAEYSKPPFILTVLDERWSDEKSWVGTDMATLVEQAIADLR